MHPTNLSDDLPRITQNSHLVKHFAESFRNNFAMSLYFALGFSPSSKAEKVKGTLSSRNPSESFD